MTKYITDTEIKELIKTKDQIFSWRNEAYNNANLIDLLDNDTLSSLGVYEIVTQYDQDYNVNFARNGEDAISNGIITENKCVNIQPKKNGEIPKAKFQFHAMGGIEYPRYILSVRNKKTLEIVRIYDISKKNNVSSIIKCLRDQSNTWLAEGKKDPLRKMKRDVIYLPEVLLESLEIEEIKTVNDCVVNIG